MLFGISKTVVSIILASAATALPIAGDAQRLSDEPVLMPRAGKFDDAGAYNPTALKVGDKTVLIYRGQNKQGTSFLGYAESADGVKFVAAEEPLLLPEADYEKDGGMEDPRIVRIDGTYYLTYTGYNKKDAQLCLLTSQDLKSWKREGVLLPAYKGSWNKGWTKSGAIVPDKLNGKYWMYYLGTADGADQMGIASSEDLLHWTDATATPVLPKRAGMFDSKVIEPGPAPILTDKGILLIYNGADDDLVYRVGWALFDKNDPTKVLARSDKPILEPAKDWEKKGQVKNVVFVEGLVRDGDDLVLYYGGGDTVTGVAKVALPK